MNDPEPARLLMVMARKDLAALRTPLIAGAIATGLHHTPALDAESAEVLPPPPSLQRGAMTKPRVNVATSLVSKAS